jgi:hypothetical protein
MFVGTIAARLLVVERSFISSAVFKLRAIATMSIATLLDTTLVLRKWFIRFLVLVTLAVPAYSQSNANWVVEVVDRIMGDDATVTSLALDRFGDLHVSYSSPKRNELRYAFRRPQDKSWNLATVDSEGVSFDSLAVDSHGRPHIAYNSPRFPGLHYAMWDGKHWQKFLIDHCKTSHQTSIQLDLQDQPRISYYREEYADRHIARDLKYAFFDGKDWYIQTVDHRGGTGRWNSIALDSAGRPYISYSITTPGNLGLAYLEQAYWDLSLADPPTLQSKRNLDGASSLALNSSGEPHIAYIDASHRSINYAWRQASAWEMEKIDSLVSAGSDSDEVSLKLDKSGRPHVAYYDSGTGALKYATRDEKTWHIETIERDNAGEHASLVLDNDDRPYISYSAPLNNEVRVAHPLRSVIQADATLEKPTHDRVAPK